MEGEVQAKENWLIDQALVDSSDLFCETIEQSLASFDDMRKVTKKRIEDSKRPWGYKVSRVFE